MNPDAGPDEAVPYFELPLKDRVVCRVGISSFLPQLRLEFWAGGKHDKAASGPDLNLDVEGPMIIDAPDGPHNVNPAEGPHPAYLHFVGAVVRQARTTRGGRLSLAFDRGLSLIVPPGALEPWKLSNDDDYLVVSIAGGGISMSPSAELIRGDGSRVR